jgi:hypothetical protein
MPVTSQISQRADGIEERESESVAHGAWAGMGNRKFRTMRGSNEAGKKEHRATGSSDSVVQIKLGSTYYVLALVRSTGY